MVGRTSRAFRFSGSRIFPSRPRLGIVTGQKEGGDDDVQKLIGVANMQKENCYGLGCGQ